MSTEWSDRLIAAVYRIRLRSQISGKVQRNQRITNPWHAVSIVTGSVVADDYICKAAMALREKRVLSAEAPQLPLRECSNPGGCRCHYQHHSDRRSDRRRARDNGLPGRDYGGPERRRSEGRRQTDL